MSHKILFLCFLFLILFSLNAQDADDITIPSGYIVEKLSETNKADDVQGLTFDAAGNLIAGSLAYYIIRVDMDRNVEVLAKTRRFDFSPIKVVISPQDEYLVICRFSPEAGSVVKISKFIPPDTFIPVIETDYVYDISYDNAGNFYTSLRNMNTNERRVVRYNSNFQEADTVLSSFDAGFMGIAFDGNNNMYLTQPYRMGYNDGYIWKIPAGDDGMPDSSDTAEILTSGIDYPQRITIDDSGNLYVTLWSHEETDGFSWYGKYKIVQIDSLTGAVLQQVAEDIANPYDLAYKDGYVYISEFDLGVISKVTLLTLEKENFTIDTGIDAAGPVAFDLNDNLYTASFRKMKLYRLDGEGTFTQVGDGTGVVQSIASNENYFYVGSLDNVTENNNQILKINPITETMDVVATQQGGFRSVAFDSYGRLILNTEIDPSLNLYGADIIDLFTGDATPYLTGLHNKARCIQFDSSQNIYFVEGTGDGIKKVWLEENYDPPRDLSSEPLFYDFRNGAFPPAIYFFYVNLLEEVFIPQMETGTILIGDKFGDIEVFAQGFLLPVHVTFDKYGSMYVSDMGNGLFKISHERWTIPAIIKIKDALIEEVQGSVIDVGVKNSLLKKLENADKSLEKGNIKPAINQIEAFKNEVEAQRGKKIPVELAGRWITTAEKIINALREVS